MSVKLLASIFLLSVSSCLVVGQESDETEEKLMHAALPFKESWGSWYIGQLEDKEKVCCVLSLESDGKLVTPDFLPHFKCKHRRHWAVFIDKEDNSTEVKIVFPFSNYPKKLYSTKRGMSGVTHDLRMFELTQGNARSDFQVTKTGQAGSVLAHRNQNDFLVSRFDIEWRTLEQAFDLPLGDTFGMGSEIDYLGFIVLGSAFGSGQNCPVCLYEFGNDFVDLYNSDQTRGKLPLSREFVECLHVVQAEVFEHPAPYRLEYRKACFEGMVKYSNERGILVFRDPVNSRLKVVNKRAELIDFPNSAETIQFELVWENEQLFLLTEEREGTKLKFRIYLIEASGVTRLGDWARAASMPGKDWSDEFLSRIFHFHPVKIGEDWFVLLANRYTSKGEMVKNQAIEIVKPSVELIPVSRFMK